MNGEGGFRPRIGDEVTWPWARREDLGAKVVYLTQDGKVAEVEYESAGVKVRQWVSVRLLVAVGPGGATLRPGDRGAGHRAADARGGAS